ncbi:MAG: hypothetical protein JW866_00225 [Ignavibacteriales bacterium]|nr:hypothetical protein [Ignavibacteriales bacterium]
MKSHTKKSFLFLCFLLTSVMLVKCNDSVSPTIPEITYTTSHEIIWEIDRLESFVGDTDAIWGASPDDIWLSGWFYDSNGNGTNLIHFDGEQWESYNYFEANLNAIFGTSKNDVWAVGNNLVYPNLDALIAHYDGVDWSTLHVEIGEPILTGVWASSSTDVFAVGLEGTILHYDGNSWVHMNSGTNMNLVDIWGFSSNDVYACGGDIDNAVNPDIPILLHYDGVTWNTVYDTVNRENNYFDTIWGESTEDLFFSATFGVYQGSNSKGWIRHNTPRDNTAIKKMRGSSNHNIFMIGHYGLLIHYNGISWYRYDDIFKKPQSAYPEPYYDLNDVLVFDKSVFIAGMEEKDGRGYCIVYKGSVN